VTPFNNSTLNSNSLHNHSDGSSNDDIDDYNLDQPGEVQTARPTPEVKVETPLEDNMETTAKLEQVDIQAASIAKLVNSEPTPKQEAEVAKVAKVAKVVVDSFKEVGLDLDPDLPEQGNV
jgi:hypothetical protein